MVELGLVVAIVLGVCLAIYFAKKRDPNDLGNDFL